MLEQYKELKINIPFHLCEDLEDMLCSDEDRGQEEMFVDAMKEFVESCEFYKKIGVDKYIKDDVKRSCSSTINCDSEIDESQKQKCRDEGIDSYTFFVPASLYDKLETLSKEIGFSINDVVVSAVGEAVDDYLYEVEQGYYELGVGYDEINKLESSLRWEMWQDHKSKSDPMKLRIDPPGSGKKIDLVSAFRRIRIEEIKKEIRKKKQERLQNIVSTVVDEFFIKE